VSASSAAAGASALTPPSRFIDPRGQRFGAGVSAAILIGASISGSPWLAALVGLDLGVSAAFGTAWFLPGRPWPRIRRSLGLPRTEPEHDYPPRFAQALGATAIGAGALAFLAGFGTVGWFLVLAVAALQTLLAATGICIGCRLYFLRWWVPSRFARLLGRTDAILRLSTSGSLEKPHA
jgi:hypothetical protein